MNARTAALAFAVAWIPPAILPHGNLERSVPASGAHLGAAPRSLRLTFTEKPQLQFTRLHLIGPGSDTVSLGAPSIDSVRTVVADIEGALVAGTYTVTWQIAGKDGHPVRGRLAFTIAPGATGLVTVPPAEPVAVDTARTSVPPAAHHDAASAPQSEGFDAGSPLYIAIRWVNFVAMLTVIGAVAFYFVVLGMLRARATPERAAAITDRAVPRLAAFAAGACVLLLIATGARLMAQTYAMHGGLDGVDAGMLGSMLLQTVWGWGWLAQAIAVIVALAAFAVARRGHRAAWVVAGLATIALAFTPALSGHAASMPRLTGLAILADGAHVLGAGGWLGSLLAVLAVGVPVAKTLEAHERGPAVADLVNAFSPTALLFAGLAAATGLFAAWLHLGAISALWQSEYGRTLLLKLGVLSVVAGTGAYNWLRVKPALGNPEGATRIRRSATVELIVGAIVIAVTAVLVATPPPMDMPIAGGP